MNKDQAFQMIEQAKGRVLTDGEADELGAWAESVRAEPLAPSPNGNSNTLVEWITRYTKETRPTQHFSENFKKVNRAVMPHVVFVFDSGKK